MSFVEITFWACAALIVHTHVTYPLSLALLSRIRRRSPVGHDLGDDAQPFVSLIIAAHNEQAVIADRVANALESGHPRERFEVIVTSDGSSDSTVELARAAGADHVLDLSRRGKVEAQNAAAEVARGEILAFSDANSFWDPDAIGHLVAALADQSVGYVCGQVRFVGADGANQEGAYWRYEMAMRSLESGLGGVTAGNGAIYATPRSGYVVMPSDRGHDLCLPYLTVRAGKRAIYEPRAQARERLAPSIRGEWERKRRMMNRTWGVLLHDRMLRPRGYRPIYAYQMFSHRTLRYASPFLHLAVLVTNVALIGEAPIYDVAMAGQLGLLLAAALARVVPLAPFRIAEYYVVVTASIAAGLIDRLRRGPATTWEPVEGTR